jgi:hypothetical protein
MDGKEGTERAPRPSRGRRLASAGLVAGGLITGAILAGSHVAGAANGTSSAATSTATTAAQGNVDPATVAHGPGETLLTDGTATKVKAAALAAVPGGTVIRVETDSDGSAYEAHVRKADGSIVTVKVDDAFKVTSTESGFGAGAPAQSDTTDA